MGRIRVLVVDDHRIFAEALAAALAAESDIEVGAAGSAGAAERALERAAREGRAFDVVLVDADLGTGSSPPAVRRPAQIPFEPPAPAQPGTAQPGPVQPGPAQPGLVPPPAAPVLPVLPGVPPPRRPAHSGAAPPPGAGSTAPPPAAPRAAEPSASAEAPRRPTESGTPPPDGITLLARARRNHPGLRAVVLAETDDPRRAARALHAGACGWVAKDSSLARLTAVVRGALRDETHLPPALLTGVIRELTTARRDRTESERLVDSLTPREKQILRCMVAGLGRQAVAERLYLSPHTVRTHMQNVLGKLGVHSTLAAVAVARRAGVSPPDPGTHPAPPPVGSTPAPGTG
ncbi:LuxR C-terminal-related transcriptional regulator [Kitasatospora sp. NBC_00240]|uniref:LuxR C-terminal-related transcriptional regulator n=1 Tax=Kitasatospora sp. NBC_00240 TaxID=2903567 RepID=UPI00225B1403|nr:LuxR C-terminal-related transcriptional regulator [Kitasatospora sp. NBC_00240]MCX5211115.1 LuxR C-terminal-related transcriptional regulator [Kitasatospora sp. NBC_00240]